MTAESNRDANRQTQNSRREFLRTAAAASAGAALNSFVGGTWFGQLAAAAETAGVTAGASTARKAKRCILLYMGGGASHVDTFDPKPGNGEFKAIPTAVPGLRVAENLPKLAGLMKDIAVIRGMSTNEGSHNRAAYLAHTGYRAGVGGVTHPTLGSVVSATLGVKDPEVPNFVRIDVGRGGIDNPGYVGPAHAPLLVHEPTKGVENIKPLAGMAEFDRSFALLDDLDSDFLKRKAAPVAQAHRETYSAAARLMHSAKVKAFDLSAEPAAGRDHYGTGVFPEACLLARRLVEAEVPFVEIDFGDWDTHKDNFPRVKRLSEQLDHGMSALLTDLKQRGLLDDTLVVWMGDFGRTPDVRGNGRGHWPAAWTTLLCGAGLKTGQVIGRTDKQGGAVEDRKVAINDFLATVCKALGIDHTREFETRAGRPMRLVAKGENVIRELF
jgi:uncharacterized protein (DUF1501 family)